MREVNDISKDLQTAVTELKKSQEAQKAAEAVYVESNKTLDKSREKVNALKQELNESLGVLVPDSGRVRQSQ